MAELSGEFLRLGLCPVYARRLDSLSEEKVLQHVHGEEFIGEIIDGRQESRGDRRKPEPIERESPPSWRMAGTAQAPPAAPVQGSGACEHQRQCNLQHRGIIALDITSPMTFRSFAQDSAST